MKVSEKSENRVRKEVVVMKNPVQYKKIEPGSAFHEKKIKNKKVNLGGPNKKTTQKTKPGNWMKRAQAKRQNLLQKKRNKIKTTREFFFRAVFYFK